MPYGFAMRESIAVGESRRISCCCYEDGWGILSSAMEGYLETDIRVTNDPRRSVQSLRTTVLVNDENSKVLDDGKDVEEDAEVAENEDAT